MAEAIVGRQPEVPVEKLLYDKEYRHSIVSTTYNKRTSLLTNISGEPLLVEYYRQYQGASEEQHGFQPNSIETYQSYTRIRGAIFKKDSKASFIFDGDKGVISEQGVVKISMDIAPLLGDLFIANIGDGRAGLYQFSQPEIRSNTVDKWYEVEYRFIAVVTKAIEDNLNTKVVQDLIYSKDKAIKGGVPLITKGEYEEDKSLYELINAIGNDIYNNFIYTPEYTVIVPNDYSTLIYDPYLADFLRTVIDTRNLSFVDPIRVISVEGSKNIGIAKPKTIWDMFLSKQYNHPERFKHNFYLHNRKALLNTKSYGGFYFSKLDKAITINEYGTPRAAYRTGGAILGTNPFPIEEQGGEKGTPYQYYFSDEFYTGNPTKENEKFIFDFFRDGTVMKSKLIEVLNKYFSMEPIDRLYMSGIYLLAARIAVSRTYKYLD